VKSQERTAVTQVVLDRDTCCGTGHGVRLAPVVFDRCQDDGSVILLNASCPGRPRGAGLPEVAYSQAPRRKSVTCRIASPAAGTIPRIEKKEWIMPS
jgi:ferredoxin